MERTLARRSTRLAGLVTCTVIMAISHIIKNPEMFRTIYWSPISNVTPSDQRENSSSINYFFSSPSKTDEESKDGIKVEETHRVLNDVFDRVEKYSSDGFYYASSCIQLVAAVVFSCNCFLVLLSAMNSRVYRIMWTSEKGIQTTYGSVIMADKNTQTTFGVSPSSESLQSSRSDRLSSAPSLVTLVRSNRKIPKDNLAISIDTAWTIAWLSFYMYCAKNSLGLMPTIVCFTFLITASIFFKFGRKSNAKPDRVNKSTETFATKMKIMKQKGMQTDCSVADFGTLERIMNYLDERVRI